MSEKVSPDQVLRDTPGDSLGGPGCLAVAFCLLLLRFALFGESSFSLLSHDGARGECSALRSRIHELYLQRERPVGRTPDGWYKILKTCQDALESRLVACTRVDELHSFALRCLRDHHLREVYLGFCVEDSCEFALSEQTLQDFVRASEEHPNFDKDLELFEQSQAPPPLEPSSEKFPVSLKPSPDQPIELD